MKPLLLLDVDGVLNILGHRPGEAPESLAGAECNGYWIVYDPKNAERLAKLAEYFELTWCTTWEHKANVYIGPLFRLPRLPVLEFEVLHPALGPSPSLIAVSPTWKLHDVRRSVGDRPLVWIDDDLQDDARGWERERAADGIPTRLFLTNPRVGLRHGEYEILLRWGQELASVTA